MQRHYVLWTTRHGQRLWEGPFYVYGTAAGRMNTLLGAVNPRIVSEEIPRGSYHGAVNIEVSSVTCPRCKQPPGQMCLRVGGVNRIELKNYHQERITEWTRMRKGMHDAEDYRDAPPGQGDPGGGGEIRM